MKILKKRTGASALAILLVVALSLCLIPRAAYASVYAQYDSWANAGNYGSYSFSSYSGSGSTTLSGSRPQYWNDGSSGGGGRGGGRGSYSFSPPPPPPADFVVKSIVPVVFRMETKALVAVNVKNQGGTAGKAVVTLDIEGKEIEMTTSDISANNNGLAFAYWTPKTGGDVELVATVNKDKKVSESDYTNNSMMVSATVTSLPHNIPAAQTVNIRRLTLDELPDEPVLSETGGTGVEPLTPEAKEKGVQSMGNNKAETTWEDGGKSYFAKLALAATASERSLKSGYGFEVEVTATITTDYTKPDFLSGPLKVAMYVPETEYEKAVILEKVSGSGLTTTWQLPVNTESPTGARQWYIPEWYQDGVDYTLLVTALGTYTPGGELTASEILRIRIDGNMYQDDYSIN